MAIDFQTEKCLGLAAAAKELSAMTGLAVRASTVWRWCRKGVGGVMLEHGVLGARLVTSMRAIGDFATKLADRGIRSPAPGNRTGGRPRGRPRSDGRRGQAVSDAKRRLERAGV